MSLLAGGDVVLDNFARGRDCANTLACVARLGKSIRRDGDRVVLTGTAAFPGGELDCGNSGTTARLLMGLLAGRRGEWTLVGDASLSQRPMERVAEPLRKMGAMIETTGGRLPVKITGRPLRAISYDAPLASAQVKSAVLLAAHQAEGITRYREPLPSRDHTERILNLARDGHGWISLDPSHTRFDSAQLTAAVPCDPSAAAFWIAAALLVPDSFLEMSGVLVNPIRVSYLRVLRQAGALIEQSEDDVRDGEPVATIRAGHSAIHAFRVEKNDAPALMDELPVLAVLAAFAGGVIALRGIGELRVKESDRLALVAEALARMGASVSVTEDSLTITGGGKLRGTEIETGGDHRIAMSFAVAALAADGNTVIHDAECVAVSDPDFWNELERLSPGSVTIAS